jgi:hypothetical protein
MKRHRSILNNIKEKVEGTTNKGRHRHKQEDDIKKWTEYSMRECTIKAHDRSY